MTTLSPPLGPVKAFIFDLDGTLADTIFDLGSSVNAVLGEFGFPPHPIDQYKRMVGDGFSALALRALPEEVSGDSNLVGAFSLRAAAMYKENAIVTTKPFPGIELLLQELAGRGLPVGVLSNKPHPMTVDMVARLFPGFPFVDVRGEIPGKAKKPHPGQALEIAGRFGLPFREWAFVGDSGVDMKTGASGGMRPIGALWGYRSREELLGAGALELASSPGDLLRFI
ncbi:MAG: HAD family hydrolase [Spirochaetota bacterium]